MEDEGIVVYFKAGGMLWRNPCPFYAFPFTAAVQNSAAAQAVGGECEHNASRTVVNEHALGRAVVVWDG